MKLYPRPALVLSCGVAASTLFVGAAAAAAPTDRPQYQPVGSDRLVTRTADGTQLNAPSRTGDLSDNGRFVVFSTGATNLGVGDSDPNTDFYVLDRSTGVSEHVSLGVDGEPSNASFPWLQHPYPVISGDAQVVAYDSPASNLVSNDRNDANDVFVHDRRTGGTYLASARPDGRPGNAASVRPDISGDGRFVVFVSAASDLVGDDDNAASDVFLFDTMTRQTELLSRDQAGNPVGGSAPSISDDGQQVVFSAPPTIVGLPASTAWVIVHLDRVAGTTSLVSEAAGGGAPDDYSSEPAISGNGRYVAFTSRATNLDPGGPAHAVGDIYLTALRTGRTRWVTEAGGEEGGASRHPVISDRGTVVAFTSDDRGLEHDDALARRPGFGAERTYRWERSTGTVERACDQKDDRATHLGCYVVAITGDARYLAFSTLDSKVVRGDENETFDIFVHRWR